VPQKGALSSIPDASVVLNPSHEKYFCAELARLRFYSPATKNRNPVSPVVPRVRMLPHTNAQSIAARTRRIFGVAGLSISEVARASRNLFRDDARFHIPPNLFHAIEQRGFRPSIQQLFVLSRLSAYRLADWLVVFGIFLDDIPRLQAILPSRYTTLVDVDAGDDRGWKLSFEQISPTVAAGFLRPLSEWIRLGLRPANPVSNADASFVYAKLGCRDAFAFPDLLPGSIVRINAEQGQASPRPALDRTRAIFLVEHMRGLVCSKLHFVEKNRIVLCPTELAYAHVELELGKEARILGIVDREFRSTEFAGPTSVPRSLAEFWSPEPLDTISAGSSLHNLLRSARRRSGLTFREASSKTAMIARTLRNKECFCAVGSLSDYESNTESPRHLHKLLSLCTVYSLSPWDFMRAAGLRLGDAGQNTMPDELRDGAVASNLATGRGDGGPTGSPHREPVAVLPYFFGRAAGQFLKMEHLSIRDIFWMGHPTKSFHPYLADALALVVDRHKKRVTTQPHVPLWAQPLYVLLRRDGQYICTSCGVDNGRLVMRPFSDGFDRPVRLQSPNEVEVVGKVVGILRSPLPARAPGFGRDAS